MSTETAKRDPNYVTTIMGVDLTTGLLPTKIYVDETTHRLLVSAVVTSNPSPSTIVAFRTTITTAGVAVQLGSNSIVGGILEAPSTNTGVIYIGGSNVSSSVFGAELQPGQSAGIALSNTNLIWADTATSGNKVAFLGS